MEQFLKQFGRKKDKCPILLLSASNTLELAQDVLQTLKMKMFPKDVFWYPPIHCSKNNISVHVHSHISNEKELITKRNN